MRSEKRVAKAVFTGRFFVKRLAESIVCFNANTFEACGHALDVVLLLSKWGATTMSKQAVHLSLNVIPDDPESSTYRFVVVSALRARQLQGGARSVLLPVSMKPTTAAMQEVRRGLIPWSDTRTLAIAEPVVEVPSV